MATYANFDEYDSIDGSPREDPTPNPPAKPVIKNPNQHDDHSDVYSQFKNQEIPPKVDQEELLLSMEVSLNQIEKKSHDSIDGYDYEQSNQYGAHYDEVRPLETAELDEYDIDPPKVTSESKEYPGYSRDIDDYYGDVKQDDIYAEEYQKRNYHNEAQEIKKASYYANEPKNYNDDNDDYIYEPDDRVQGFDPYEAEDDRSAEKPYNYSKSKDHFEKDSIENDQEYFGSKEVSDHTYY